MLENERELFATGDMKYTGTEANPAVSKNVCKHSNKS